MKKFRLISLFILFCIFLSCNSNEPALNGSTPSVSTSLSVSPDYISIEKSASTVYISVKSNTEWTVYVNNMGKGGINELDVSPLSGKNDGTIKVKYGAINTTYYDAQQAVVNVFYYSNGYKQSKSISIQRKGKYN